MITKWRNRKVPQTGDVWQDVVESSGINSRDLTKTALRPVILKESEEKEEGESGEDKKSDWKKSTSLKQNRKKEEETW